MNNSLTHAQNRFISYMASVCHDFGLNPFVAQLYGVLYMSDKPLSLDELTERLGVSKGNVSINIRELEKWSAVRKVWVKGSRKDYYEAELNIKKIISNKLKSSVGKRMNEVSSMLEDVRTSISEGRKEMSEEEKKMAKIYEERLKRIEDLKKLASNALSIAEKFL